MGRRFGGRMRICDLHPAFALVENVFVIDLLEFGAAHRRTCNAVGDP